MKTGGEVKERKRRDGKVLTFTDGLANKQQTFLRRGCRLPLRCHRRFANVHV